MTMAHARCIPDTYGYIQTIKIFDSHCFSTTKMVARRRLKCGLKVLTDPFVYVGNSDSVSMLAVICD
jgi:hypothetical protein